MSRYRVTELPGFRGMVTGGNAAPGLSVHVVDSRYAYRIMGSWRTESYRCSRAEAKLRCRRAARALADRLNAELEFPDGAR